LGGNEKFQKSVLFFLKLSMFFFCPKPSLPFLFGTHFHTKEPFALGHTKGVEFWLFCVLPFALKQKGIQKGRVAVKQCPKPFALGQSISSNHSSLNKKSAG
jgi:hypothetical protein